MAADLRAERGNAICRVPSAMRRRSSTDLNGRVAFGLRGFLIKLKCDENRLVPDLPCRRRGCERGDDRDFDERVVRQRNAAEMEFSRVCQLNS